VIVFFVIRLYYPIIKITNNGILYWIFLKKKHITFWGCINNIYKIIYIYIVDGSLEVKLPTIWTDEKQRWEELEKRREEKKKEYQKEKVPEERRCRCAKR
jgi:hypothetical protein